MRKKRNIYVIMLFLFASALNYALQIFVYSKFNIMLYPQTYYSVNMIFFVIFPMLGIISSITGRESNTFLFVIMFLAFVLNILTCIYMIILVYFPEILDGLKLYMLRNL